jgi:hypothetical protein
VETKQFRHGDAVGTGKKSAHERIMAKTTHSLRRLGYDVVYGAGTAVSTSAPQPTSTELRDIALKVSRLVPDRHDPELYHLSKSEIVRALQRMARRAESGRAQ